MNFVLYFVQVVKVFWNSDEYFPEFLVNSATVFSWLLVIVWLA